MKRVETRHGVVRARPLDDLERILHPGMTWCVEIAWTQGALKNRGEVISYHIDEAWATRAMVAAVAKEREVPR